LLELYFRHFCLNAVPSEPDRTVRPKQKEGILDSQRLATK